MWHITVLIIKFSHMGCDKLQKISFHLTYRAPDKCLCVCVCVGGGRILNLLVLLQTMLWVLIRIILIIMVLWCTLKLCYSPISRALVKC